MRKLLFALSIFAIFNLSHAQYQLMGGEGAPGLKQGDIIVGGKLALGSVYGANVGFIAHAEYGLRQGFLNIPKFPASLGVGATFGYSSYSVDTFWGDYDYSNYLILGAGYWHVALIPRDNIDTYLVVNLGFNIDTVSKPSGSGVPGRDSSEGGLVFGTGVGIKYYFMPNLAAVAEAGFGMGVLRIGIDFRI